MRPSIELTMKAAVDHLDRAFKRHPELIGRIEVTPFGFLVVLQRGVASVTGSVAFGVVESGGALPLTRAIDRCVEALEEVAA